MSTPDVQRDPIASGRKSSTLVPFSGIGRFNAAMLAIGAVSAAGFLIVLYGAYLTAAPNAGIILAGTIIIILTAVVWIAVGLLVIGGIVIGWVTSRGKAMPEARTNQESQ